MLGKQILRASFYTYCFLWLGGCGETVRFSTVPTSLDKLVTLQSITKEDRALSANKNRVSLKGECLSADTPDKFFDVSLVVDPNFEKISLFASPSSHEIRAKRLLEASETQSFSEGSISLIDKFHAGTGKYQLNVTTGKISHSDVPVIYLRTSCAQIEGCSYSQTGPLLPMGATGMACYFGDATTSGEDFEKMKARIRLDCL